VRLRLRSTAVVVRNEAGGVAVGYVCDGELRRVAAKRCVLATYGMVMPHLCPEMPDEQKALLAQNIKSPLIYTKVLIRSWESWQKLRVHSIAAPMSFHTTVKLDYPVSLGGYRFPRDPKEPIGLQLVHVPLAPNQGLTAREQCRAGRQRLLEMTFADFEAQTRADLDRMLGPGGFDAKRDILAITVNRWAHGYSYFFNSLYDDVDAAEASMEKARAPVGRIALANSDTAWDAYAHAAIAEAARAIDELSRV
jgi:spermidine dehydrogenase